VRFPAIGRILSTDDNLQPVVAKALEIRALAALCVQFLPPELANEVQAANLRNGGLVLLAAHPAAAAKLRLITESLAKFLLKQGAKVNSVSVKVQPTTSRKKNVASHKNSRLSPAALSQLAALHARLHDSPARSALAMILERHGVPTPTQSPAGTRKRREAGSGRRRS
jgi:hypothetical protein